MFVVSPFLVANRLLRYVANRLLCCVFFFRKLIFPEILLFCPPVFCPTFAEPSLSTSNQPNKRRTVHGAEYPLQRFVSMQGVFCATNHRCTISAKVWESNTSSQARNSQSHRVRWYLDEVSYVVGLDQFDHPCLILEYLPGEIGHQA